MFSSRDADEVLQIARELAVRLSKHSSVAFVFSDDYRFGAGGVRRFDSEHAQDGKLLVSVDANGFSPDARVVWHGGGNPKYVMTVGVRGLYSVLEESLLSRDAAMASVFASMLHEMRHVQQYEVAAGTEKQPDNMSMEVLCSLTASCDNKDMYMANYRCMPHEIDAERVGVIDAFDLLCGLIGQERAGRAMSLALFRTSVIGIGPICYLHALSVFDKDSFLVESDRCMRKAIDSSRNVKILHERHSPDFAARYLSLNEQDRKVFLSLRTGTEQDAYLAKINVEFNDKERAFFDRDALLLPDTVPELLGGVLTKSVAVVDERRPIEGVFFDDVTDDELQL